PTSPHPPFPTRRSSDLANSSRSTTATRAADGRSADATDGVRNDAAERLRLDQRRADATVEHRAGRGNGDRERLGDVERDVLFERDRKSTRLNSSHSQIS